MKILNLKSSNCSKNKWISYLCAWWHKDSFDMTWWRCDMTSRCKCTLPNLMLCTADRYIYIDTSVYILSAFLLEGVDDYDICTFIWMYFVCLIDWLTWSIDWFNQLIDWLFLSDFIDLFICLISSIYSFVWFNPFNPLSDSIYLFLCLITLFYYFLWFHWFITLSNLIHLLLCLIPSI